MTARQSSADDGDWRIACALIGVFSVLVALILGAVPGWSTPLHVWIALAGLVDAVLAAHAGARAGLRATRGRARDALLALALAASLGIAATMLVMYGRLHPITPEDAPADEALPPAAGPR